MFDETEFQPAWNPSEKLVMLAEAAGIEPIHLIRVSEEDAITALVGVILYRHMDSQGQSEVRTQRRTLPTSLRAALNRAQERFSAESVEWQNTNGATQVARGVAIQYDTLGITPDRVHVNGIDLHFALLDENLLVFRDNPSLWYYIQDAQQGRFNYYSALLAQRAAQLFGAYILSIRATKISGIRRVIDRLSSRAPAGEVGQFIAGSGVFLAQDAIPLWGNVVGTAVPKSGRKTIIVYLSEDNTRWDRRVRFDIGSDGSVTHRIF